MKLTRRTLILTIATAVLIWPAVIATLFLEEPGNRDTWLAVPLVAGIVTGALGIVSWVRDSRTQP